MSDEKKISEDERRQLGNQQKLWHIEVWYRQGVKTLNIELPNRTHRELWDFRNHVFTAGIMVPVDPVKYRIVHPQDILEIICQLQKKFYE